LSSVASGTHGEQCVFISYQIII